MKKKILSIALVVCLLATALVSGTLAYFTDADKDVNVMTSGNINIVQNETDREGNAWNVEGSFNGENPKLVPAVYLKPDAEGKMVPYNPATTWEGPGGYQNNTDLWQTGTMPNTTGEGTLKIYDGNIENEIDKVISVTNKGTEDAFVRTIILLEENAAGDAYKYLHWFMAKGTVEISSKMTIDNQSYIVLARTYENALAEDETSEPSLMQVWLDPSAGNDWYEAFGNDYQIIAISQAAQTTGFDSAAEALNTAFGEIDADNIAEWLTKTTIETGDVDNVIGGNY